MSGKSICAMAVGFHPISQDTPLQPSRHACADVFRAPHSTSAKAKLLPFCPQNFVHLDHYYLSKRLKSRILPPMPKGEISEHLSPFPYPLQPLTTTSTRLGLSRPPLLFLLSLLPLTSSTKTQCADQNQ